MFARMCVYVNVFVFVCVCAVYVQISVQQIYNSLCRINVYGYRRNTTLTVLGIEQINFTDRHTEA